MASYCEAKNSRPRPYRRIRPANVNLNHDAITPSIYAGASDKAPQDRISTGRARRALEICGLGSITIMELIGVCSCVGGLLLASAEAPSDGWQFACSLGGLVMFAVPLLIAMRTEAKREDD